MMNKMNMKFHVLYCAKEISVHNRNIHQAPFSGDTASKYTVNVKKVNRHTIVRNTCMELNCFINFHLEFYKMSHSVRTDRQFGSRSDCTDCTVRC